MGEMGKKKQLQWDGVGSERNYVQFYFYISISIFRLNSPSINVYIYMSNHFSRLGCFGLLTKICSDLKIIFTVACKCHCIRFKSIDLKVI